MRGSSVQLAFVPALETRQRCNGTANLAGVLAAGGELLSYHMEISGAQDPIGTCRLQ
jgi:hypothetical protein